MSNGFVICFGMGVVFIGLICIVFLVSLTGKIIQSVEKKRGAKQPVAAPAAAPAVATTAIPNRAALVAAIAAVIAEEEGRDVSGIRILSIKRV